MSQAQAKETEVQAIRDYFKDQVDPYMQPLIVHLYKNIKNIKNVREFMKEWLSEEGLKIYNARHQKETEVVVEEKGEEEE